MTDFVKLPIETTPQAMLEEAVAEMEALIEGWNPNLGEYELILFQAMLWRLVWPFVQMASKVDAAIFNEWGNQIVKLVPGEAEKATVASTWEVIDTDGYTIRAGWQVDLVVSGDERVGFVVVSDVVIPPGQTKTGTGEVALEAIEPGTGGNDLSGNGILVDSIGFVVEDSIDLVGESGGGTDAEPAERYLGRLAETIQTMIEGVVVPSDVEIVVRNVPGVGRALAIDNFNAETGEDEEEKTTTVAVATSSGTAVAATVKEAVEAKLEGTRELNYIFFVVDPTFYDVDVESTVVPSQGYSQAAADANAEAAIRNFLDPARFGQSPPGDAGSWQNTATLRYQDLVTAINNAEGVDHYSLLKWRKAADAMGTADIALTGVAPLPRPDTIAVG